MKKKDPLASVFSRSIITFCIRVLASLFIMRVCGALLSDLVNPVALLSRAPRGSDAVGLVRSANRITENGSFVSAVGPRKLALEPQTSFK